MRRRLIALTMGAAVLTAGTAQATAPTADPVPLTGWNLVIPVDSDGGDSGDATTVSPAALSSPWLTRDSSGALDFWAPANGARLGISLHARTGAGLAALLRAAPGLEVVGEAEDGEQTPAVAAEHEADVILMDVRMPGMGGSGAAGCARGCPG